MTKSITELATSICKILFEEGYTAYFAGGWVRDLILNRPSDEIDIATSAPPYIIQKLFPKTVPVGIAFGVVIVVLDGINFEVTTFRKDHPYLDGRHPEGVDFSTPEKDASRRDFTINGMFYDPLTDTFLDFVGGQDDLQKKIIRAIGNPDERFTEDRLRMIRAVRFAARFGFKIDKNTEQAIVKHAHTLFPSVSMERILQEFHKMRPMDLSILLLQKYGILPVIFPSLRPLSLIDLEKRVASFKYFPFDCPTILYLMELFPDLSLEKKIGLCHYLKTTSNDAKLVEFFYHSHALFQKLDLQRVDWAKFYAHPFHELFLQVESAKILPPERASFLKIHETRKEKLLHHIQRIKDKHPLVDATLLQAQGIKPGKVMGELLKEAEKIVVNEDITAPTIVLERLKKSPLWPN